jgi:hypothetical protein
VALVSVKLLRKLNHSMPLFSPVTPHLPVTNPHRRGLQKQLFEADR